MTVWYFHIQLNQCFNQWVPLWVDIELQEVYLPIPICHSRIRFLPVYTCPRRGIYFSIFLTFALLSLFQSSDLRRRLWPDKALCRGFMAEWVEEDGGGPLCVCPSGLTRVTRTLHNHEARRMTTLSLSVSDSLLLQLTKFPSVSLRVLHPGVISPAPLSLIIPPPFFFSLSLSVTASLFLLPAHFFVSSNSSVTTLANISLQLVWDWARLFLWFTELCALCCMCA